MTIIRNAASALALSILLASPAFADDTVGSPEEVTSPAAAPANEPVDEAANEDGPPTSASDIVVLGRINYRNRSESTEPVLVYDQEYFQRFEPLTAGDALKRVPSVTFLSDVIESDGARLRGLAPGYTQILINGEKVPGSNADRSFFMDRIPAELISRVEIVRSSSARRSGDAMAGTLNIVLRDGYQLDGGYVRAGALHFDDGKWKPSFGAVWGGEVGPGRLLLGVNVQGRYNPKRKVSYRHSDSPENNPDYATEDFDNREDQTDTRNGTDYSANATYKIEGDNTDFEVNGFYVRTDRTETERSNEYNVRTGEYGPVANDKDKNPGLLVDNANVKEIDQENYSLSAKLAHRWSLGKTSFKVGYAKFYEKSVETEYELEFDRKVPRLTADLTHTKFTDEEFSMKLDHEFEVSDAVNFVVGGFFQNKSRGTGILENRNRFDVPTARKWDQFTQNPTTLNTGFGTLEAGKDSGNLNQLKEKRRDAFAMFEGKGGAFSWEAGLRYEHTNYDIHDATAHERPADQVNKYGMWLPSASIKFDLTNRDRLTASVARTNRRPDFNYLTPSLLEEELGDNDLLGNPQLDPESAWGADLGYEHRLGRAGVVGVNVFYRKVKNLIELANTGARGSAYEDNDTPGNLKDDDVAWVFQPRNTGNGDVYGVEFDLSTDLGFIGLPDTGIFGNVSWLDSDIKDTLGKRRFNGQSKYVYNFGFIQDIPSFGAAFGATYRKQGAAYDRTVGEEVTTTYGADLEVFVEKRFGKNFTIRAVGSNLLNGKKRETFNKFNTLEEQIARDFDEYELEAEKAGPVFQVMARFAF